MLICALIMLFILLWIIIAESIFRKSEYYKQTGKGLFALRVDAGTYGEYLTYKNLQEFEKNGAKFLFNCYLPTEKGKTSEIDVIMIHTSGVYVFESKNYSGWIFGSEDSHNWTQTLPSGRKAHKEHFYNPIMQNRTHIKWLRKQIGDTIPVHSIIVFSERCELKDISLHSTDIKVIQRYSLYSTVCAICSENTDRISTSMVEELYTVLLKYVNVSQSVKEQHIKDIQTTATLYENHKTHTITSLNMSSMICPKCGGSLVLRNAKKGKYAGQSFFGCSNYPRCRYTKSPKES